MSEALGGNVRREAEGMVWFEPPEPLGGIGHVVMTSRLGGQSLDAYESLNLGFHVGDVAERVRLNRTRLAKAIGRKLLDPVVGEQVHGAAVHAVGELHAGTRWQTPERALAGVDALITGTRRLPLVVMVADCVPVAIVDPARQVGAVVHAGWRGIDAGVLENTIDRMRETWASFPSDLVAWIGPSNGPCCYEVGPEVSERFLGGVVNGNGDRCHLDLRRVIQNRLAAAGLLEENRTGMDLCTCCHPELFFSHRRAQREGVESTGRQALLMWLEKPPF